VLEARPKQSWVLEQVGEQQNAENAGSSDSGSCAFSNETFA
jgi:hypothetical protein